MTDRESGGRREYHPIRASCSCPFGRDTNIQSIAVGITARHILSEETIFGPVTPSPSPLHLMGCFFLEITRTPFSLLSVLLTILHTPHLTLLMWLFPPSSCPPCSQLSDHFSSTEELRTSHYPRDQSSSPTFLSL